MVIRIKPSVDFNVTADDMARLKELAAGVGWEFEPNPETAEGLKRIGVKRIRCINVDPLDGTFDDNGQFHVGKPGYLGAHLDTCRAVGASPHIILATGVHPDLRVKAEDVKTDDERLMGMLRSSVFGPSDWGRFRSYCKGVFQYVLLDQQFPEAAFEVGNEPDIAGPFPVEAPPRPERGSRALYEAYLKVYRNVAAAAAEFEAEHPGTRVAVGGPALAWAFTFRFGDFNWTEQFLRDCGAAKTKLDFIGLHFYGNIAPLRPADYGAYPSFSEMLRSARQWRDEFVPGVPFWFTEWGATYHTSLDPQSLHNGNHVGAAFAAAFLNEMLVGGVERAIYLVTTDLRQPFDGEYKAIWGWPSLFTNPQVHGTHPKAPYHVFQMLTRMAPRRIESMNPGERWVAWRPGTTRAG